MPIDRYYILRDKRVEKWNMHKAAQAVIAKGGSGVSTAEFNDEYERVIQAITKWKLSSITGAEGIYFEK